jgi:hypothetical protein
MTLQTVLGRPERAKHPDVVRVGLCDQIFSGAQRFESLRFEAREQPRFRLGKLVHPRKVIRDVNCGFVKFQETDELETFDCPTCRVSPRGEIGLLNEIANQPLPLRPENK